LLYMNAVPVAKGFYDWTDDSPENIWYIKKMIEHTIKSTIFDVENCNCWMDEWGEKPEDFHTRQKILMERLRAAPKLIPIHEHYFIPEAGPCDTGNPVFDFIQLCEAHCQAETLWLFFERYFKHRQKDD